METTGIRVKYLLNEQPKSMLEELSAETKVAYQVKKLSGKLMFMLLLYAVLTATRLSLNVLVLILDSVFFRYFAHLDQPFQPRRNSLADRLATINSGYFEAFLAKTTHLLNQQFSSDNQLPYRIRHFDSTIVSLSSKLLAWSTASNQKMSAIASNNLNLP